MEVRNGPSMGMRTLMAALTALAVTAALAGCNGHAQSFVPTAPAGGAAAFYDPAAQLPTPVRHVVIIFQENRTADYMFQDVPGADVTKSAIDSRGERVRLHEVSLATTYDLGHYHRDFVADYNGGRMNGFDSRLPDGKRALPYGYGIPSEIRPYHDMAVQYVAADHMFQTNQGPSYPAHLYIVSGTATEPQIRNYRVEDNPFQAVTRKWRAGGCASAPDVLVSTIDVHTGSAGPDVYPCFDRPVLSDFLDRQHVSWRYYQQQSQNGLWHALNSIRHVRFGPDFANVISPPQTILSDVAAGRLAGVSWVMPDNVHSDHASNRSAAGPSWVAAVVNAIGRSKYWNSTAIFITWDDWGGWYDHVKPPIDNAYELGFRVPLIVVSPYAKRGYVSKNRHEFGSILAFAEVTFGIPKGALNSTDVRADDLRDTFNFAQSPRTFVPIKAPPFQPGPASDRSEDP